MRFYQFPKEHWVHLRTSNPIESIFAGVRLRTNAAKRLQTRESALYLVFKLVQRLSANWRTLNGGENLMRLMQWPPDQAACWRKRKPRHRSRTRRPRSSWPTSMETDASMRS